jgi:hypothetical protein
VSEALALDRVDPAEARILDALSQHELLKINRPIRVIEAIKDVTHKRQIKDAIARVCYPYCVLIWRNQPGVTLLGRNYKPVGCDQRSWYDYEDHVLPTPRRDVAKLMALLTDGSMASVPLAQSLQWQPQSHVFGWMYDRGTHGVVTNWKAYQSRVAVLLDALGLDRLPVGGVVQP